MADLLQMLTYKSSHVMEEKNVGVGHVENGQEDS